MPRDQVSDLGHEVAGDLDEGLVHALRGSLVFRRRFSLRLLLIVRQQPLHTRLAPPREG